MKRNWYKSTIFTSCVAIFIVGAVALVVTGWDDSGRHLSIAEGPAAPSVTNDPSRSVIVVLRPDDEADGAVPDPDQRSNIWQAALPSEEREWRLESRVRTFIDAVCPQAGEEAVDFESAAALDAVCKSAVDVKVTNLKGDGEILLTENWADADEFCDLPICLQFHFEAPVSDEINAAEYEAFAPAEPVIIVH
jgi:hypothetical protein